MRNLQDINLTPGEYLYYGRHLLMPDFGIDAQKKLKGSRVVVVGAGGLGAPLLQYLAAAGVGTIGIIDFDHVETANLHRQILFGMSDVGRLKTEAARERLQQINPHITVGACNEQLTAGNKRELLSGYDIVADCTDNFSTRYLINDAATMLGIPNVYGAITQFEGQISVFNYTDKNGVPGPGYRDLYPKPPPAGLIPDCAEAGVLGVLPGIIGSIQANEVIKIITGIGNVLSGKLFLFDVLNFESRIVHFDGQKSFPDVGKSMDDDLFCGCPVNGSKINCEDQEMQEISILDYREMLDSGEDLQLIDVRSPWEREIVQIGGDGIPLADIQNRAGSIRRDCKVIFYCQSGKRSADAVRQLQKECNFTNLYSLKGGVLAWIQEMGEP